MSAPVEDQRPISDGFTRLREGLSALAPLDSGRPLTVNDVLGSPELMKLLKDRDARNYRKIMYAVGALGVALVVIVMIGFFYGQTQNSRQDAALQRSQDTINAFRSQLDSSNVKLISMGLPPVQAPQIVEPGSPEQAQLILAAGVAKTVSDFPPQVIERPVTAKLAEASAKGVSDFVAMNQGRTPIDPQPVIDQVAAYLAVNRDQLKGAQGEQGVPGVPGPPPTSAQITDAFLAAAKANPQLLCVAGGTFQEFQVKLADGGSVGQFGCFGERSADPTEPPRTGTGSAPRTVEPTPVTPDSSTAPAPTTTEGDPGVS